MFTRNHIDQLFDELWPLMPYSSQHKLNCMEQYPPIEAAFRKYKNDHELLLKAMQALPNLGIPLASGLIWTMYPDTRVPFDQYTLGYALQLRILLTDKILGNYVASCDKIVEYCKSRSQDGAPFTIEDFVREAGRNLGDYPELGTPPK